MSHYIYRIHEETTTEDRAMSGWGESEGYKGKLNKLAEYDIIKLDNKIASSLPTIFSRLEHFNNALNFLTQDKKARNAKTKSTEHYLVGELLDFFELIFAAPERILYKTWSRDRIKNIKSETLREILTYFFNRDLGRTDEKGATHEVILIYFQPKEGKKLLIGGTSKKTILFTSPNWKHNKDTIASKYPDIFKRKFGDDKYELFNGTARPLERRDKNFQEFMFFLKARFEQLFNNYCKGLSKYISDTSGYKPLKNKYQVIQPIETIINFIFRNDTGGNHAFFNKYLHEHNNQKYVMIDNVFSSIIRLGENNEGKRIFEDFKDYPHEWMVTSDVFCNEIAILPFNANKNHFDYPSKGNIDKFNFLLPIKLDYFKLADNTNGIHCYRKIILKQGVYSFQADIEVNNSRSLRFTKSYDKTKQKAIYFNLGIFPWTTETKMYWIKTIQNKSEKILIKSENQADISLNELEPNSSSMLYKVHGRMPKQLSIYKGIKYLGILQPQPKNTSKTYESAEVAIDFGTTNTHIAIKTRGESSGEQLRSFTIKDPLDILTAHLSELPSGEPPFSEADFKKIHTGGVEVYGNRLNSQFVPMFFSKNTDFSFPTRSVIFHNKDSNDKTGKTQELFYHDWIGFRYYKEVNSRYIFDIKWSNDNKHLSKLYLRELLTMVKYYLNSNGVEDEKIVLKYTYPLSLGDLSFYKEIWNDALDSVWQNKNINKKVSESVAPFLWQRKDIEADEIFVNLDIGGGTTDIFLGNDSDRKYVNSSLVLGANYIWGCGVRSTLKRINENGFYKYIKQIEQDDEVAALLQGLENGSIKRAEDFFSTVFDIQRYSISAGIFVEKLKHYKDTEVQYLRLAQFMHLASILYHTAELLEEDFGSEYKYCKIQFTGNGSKYLNYLDIRGSGGQDGVEIIVPLLMKAFTTKNTAKKEKTKKKEKTQTIDYEFSVQKVNRNEVKEATALGALSEDFTHTVSAVLKYSNKKAERKHVKTIGKDDWLNDKKELKEYIDTSLDDILTCLEDKNIIDAVNYHFGVNLTLLKREKNDIKQKANRYISSILDNIDKKRPSDELFKAGVEISGDLVSLHSTPFCWLFQNMYYWIASK